MPPASTISEGKDGEPALAELFEYLDELRESGVTNMYGATPYLMRHMQLDRARARVVLMQWMDSFDPDKSAELRAIEVAAISKAVSK